MLQFHFLSVPWQLNLPVSPETAEDAEDLAEARRSLRITEVSELNPRFGAFLGTLPDRALVSNRSESRKIRSRKAQHFIQVFRTMITALSPSLPDL
jgi:hypothetical protein